MRGIPYPVVPKGEDRIRVVLHAGNTEAELDGFVACLVEWAEGVRRTQADGSEKTKTIGLARL